MLKAKLLPKVLEQANGDGVRKVILLNREGSLVSSSRAVTEQERAEDTNLAGIACNLWTSNETVGRTSVHAKGLDIVLVDNESGRFALASVANMILCVVAEKTTEFGMLKVKINALRQFLHEPLNVVAPDTA